MLRDQFAKDHVELLQQTHDQKFERLVGLDERLAAGDETVFSRINHGSEAVTLITAMYGLGASFAELRDQARRIPGILVTTQDRIFNPHKTGGAVLVVLNAAALVALFEDESGARQLIDVVERFEVEDFLVDSYINSLVAFREPSPGLQMDVLDRNLGITKPSLYAGQREAAQLALAGDDVGAAEQLGRYVSQWYRTHAASFEWLSPQRSGRFYSGDWCFTAAATAKVFGIDDAALEHHDRYPWDLAHPSG